MFKVECEGCSAPYEIDERRVPASGLKMRCPKCGSTLAEERHGNVVVDRCHSKTCGGVYFDAGELEKVRKKWEAQLPFLKS